MLGLLLVLVAPAVAAAAADDAAAVQLPPLPWAAASDEAVSISVSGTGVVQRQGASMLQTSQLQHSATNAASAVAHAAAAAVVAATDAEIGARASVRGDPAPASELEVISTPAKAKQHLRICNAYAMTDSLQVTFVRVNENLGEIPYADCKDFDLLLQETDQFDFAMAKNTVGTFAVSGLPSGSRTLLLIVSKKPGNLLGTSFKSHAFMEDESGSSQVAVIDTFRGSSKSSPKVQIRRRVEAESNTTHKPEDLALDSVVAIAPGKYSLDLTGGVTLNMTETFNAAPQRNYVVMRVGDGSDKDNKDAFPERLVVFPQTGAAVRSVGFGSLCLVVLGFALRN